MKLVFFGTPAFAVPVLQAVHSAGHEILAVVTQPDRPRGRKKVLTPPEAKVCAQALGLSVLQFERIKRPEAVQALASLDADVWVTAAYGQILWICRPKGSSMHMRLCCPPIAAPHR